MPIIRAYKFVWPAPKGAGYPLEEKFYYAKSLKDAKKDFKRSEGIDPDDIKELIIVRQPA